MNRKTMIGVAAGVAVAGIATVIFFNQGDSVTSGTVIDRKYEASYTYTYFINGPCIVWVKSGNSQICAAYQQIPLQGVEPEHYRLRLRDDGNDTRTGWITVSSIDYEKCGVSAEYPACAK